MTRVTHLKRIRTAGSGRRWVSGPGPGQVARSTGAKLPRIWDLWVNKENVASWPLRRLLILLMMLTYVPVLMLGILGAAKTAGQGWPYW